VNPQHQLEEAIQNAIFNVIEAAEEMIDNEYEENRTDLRRAVLKYQEAKRAFDSFESEKKEKP
jgi:hypothetical protein